MHSLAEMLPFLLDGLSVTLTVTLGGAVMALLSAFSAERDGIKFASIGISSCLCRRLNTRRNAKAHPRSKGNTAMAAYHAPRVATLGPGAALRPWILRCV